MSTQPSGALQGALGFLAQAPVGVAVLDLELRFRALNEAMARLNQVPANEHLGRTWGEVSPVLSATIDGPMRQALTEHRALSIELSSDSVGPAQTDGAVADRSTDTDPQPRRWLASFFPVDEAGTPTGLGVLVRDVTDWYRALLAQEQGSALVQATFTAALDCIIGMDAEGLITEFNPAAERVFDQRRADVIGRELASVIIPPGLRDAHRAGLHRHLSTGQSHILDRRLDMVAMRAGGEEFPVELTVARASAPGPAQFIGYLRDLSAAAAATAERERLLAAERLSRASAESQRARLSVLARAGAVLSSSLDYETTLREVARVAMPPKADWCTIDLLDDGGQLRRVAAAHADARRDGVAQKLLEYPAPWVGAGSPLQRVLSGGEAELMNGVDTQALEPQAVSDQHRHLLDRLGLHAAIVAPLRAREHTLGLITFAAAQPEQAFDEDDVRLAGELGRRAGNAVENSRLFADTQQMAVELRGTQRRLESILGSLAEAVTVRSADDRTLYANDAAVRLLGLDSAEQLSAAPAGTFAERFLMEDENGRMLTLNDLPGSQVLAGQEAKPMLVRNVVRATGQERWMMVKSTPLLGENGQVEAAINVLEDVTATRRATLRTAFLADASEVLASSLDYEQTLRNVAGLAVPRIADWCAIELVDADGEREQVAVAHIDPAKLRLAERLREFEPEEVDPDQGLGLVLRTGRSQLYAEIADDLLAQAAVDASHLQLLRDVGMRSVLLAPMNVGARTIGALTLVNAESGRVFDEGDVAFAEQVAERAAVAVENARLYTARAAIARTLQDSLLPQALPQIPGWEVAALYRPAGHGVEVGGDFYDFWPLQGGWTMMIGDVTGKGVQAAALTSLVRHTARTASGFAAAPADVLTHVNATMRADAASLLVCSALCLHLDGPKVTLCAGGHPLPLRVRDSAVCELGHYGPLLGAFSDRTWKESEHELQPGDLLVAFTDGVTDTVGEQGRFGPDRLRATLASAAPASPTVVVAALDRALSDFQVGAQADDTAAVALRYTG